MGQCRGSSSRRLSHWATLHSSRPSRIPAGPPTTKGAAVDDDGAAVDDQGAVDDQCARAVGIDGGLGLQAADQACSVGGFQACSTGGPKSSG